VNTARRFARSLIAGAFHATGALDALQGARRVLGGPRVHILAFHRVVDRIEDLPLDVIPPLAITTASLRELLLVARRGFEVLPLSRAAEVVEGTRRAARDVVAITFDDGYRDVFLRVRPLLAELGLPATVFVPTGYIGSDEPLLHDRLHAALCRVRAERRDLGAAELPEPIRSALSTVEPRLLGARPSSPGVVLDELIRLLDHTAVERLTDRLEERLGVRFRPDAGGRVMSAPELRACVDAGITLGAHTIDHRTLTRERWRRVLVELRRPRVELEAIADRPCLEFAYCNGLWSVPLVHAVAEAGYRVAVTTHSRSNRVGDERLRLGRRVLWEGHARGIAGRSRALLAAHIVDLFGSLGAARNDEGRAAWEPRWSAGG
jgi:peptidoglycan/xylan/chitin deacetylase (PgdA/CDA1 family)